MSAKFFPDALIPIIAFGPFLVYFYLNMNFKTKTRENAGIS